MIVGLILTGVTALVALGFALRYQLRDAHEWVRAKRFRREVVKWHRESSKSSSQSQ